MQLVRLLLAGGAFGPFAFDGDGVTGGEAGQLAREAAIAHAAEPTHSLFGEIRRQNNLQRRQRGAIAQGRKSNALLLADGTHPAVDADALSLARAGEQAGDGRGESHSSARCRAPRAGGRQLGHHLGQRGAGRVLMLSELTGGFSTRSGCRNSQDRASPKRGPPGHGSRGSAASSTTPAQNNVFVPAYDVAALLSPCFAFRCVVRGQLQTGASQAVLLAWPPWRLAAPP